MGHSRRRFLTLATGLAASPLVWAMTPTQPQGPFYPVRPTKYGDTDLTRLDPGAAVAEGKLLRIQGRVLDSEGTPVPAARVEIWQADAYGHYRHPRDRSGRRDPRFQGWGSADTDPEGHYGFVTIKPPPYPAGQGWVRPPHIHFRVSSNGQAVLTTQLYFADEPLNDRDLLLNRLPPSQQKLLITPLHEVTGNLQGHFDLVVPRPDRQAHWPLTPADPMV